jgi:hypothetical protein
VKERDTAVGLRNAFRERSEKQSYNFLIHINSIIFLPLLKSEKELLS